MLNDTWQTNNPLTDGRAEQIVEYINNISELCAEGVNVVYVESDRPPISIVIHDPNLYDEVVSIGHSSSINN